jgi:hypothetical protein
MHPATLQHVCGMISVIRQALSSVEAAVAAEMELSSKGKNRTVAYEESEDSKFLDENADRMLGKILDLNSGDDDEKGAK